MSNVVPFPGQPIDPDDAPRTREGAPITECADIVHVFASIPGRCQCGEEFWESLTVFPEGIIGVFTPE